MKQYRKLAIGVASVGIALAAAAAFAQSGPMGDGTGPMMGMHGKMSGSMHGGSTSGHMAGQKLMTPQEREALHEKMRNAKTEEERQALAAATRAEMEKRAKEMGITLPEHGGMAHMGMGGMGRMGGGTPAGGEHKH